jgi:hypothetical protein
VDKTISTIIALGALLGLLWYLLKRRRGGGLLYAYTRGQGLAGTSPQTLQDASAAADDSTAVGSYLPMVPMELLTNLPETPIVWGS